MFVWIHINYWLVRVEIEVHLSRPMKVGKSNTFMYLYGPQIFSERMLLDSNDKTGLDVFFSCSTEHELSTGHKLKCLENKIFLGCCNYPGNKC